MLALTGIPQLLEAFDKGDLGVMGCHMSALPLQHSARDFLFMAEAQAICPGQCLSVEAMARDAIQQAEKTSLVAGWASQGAG